MSDKRPTRVVFRADASLQIGTGHVMRCLTLADALKVEGAECHFVCREHAGHMPDLIRERGHVAYGLRADEISDKHSALSESLSPSHASWLGCHWRTDAVQTLDVLNALQPDWLVVDHYALDARWENAIRTYCRKLMVIDDLADRPHDCDLLLDQTLGRSPEDYRGLVPAETTILAGPKYALLRPEFAALREYSLARRETPRLERILVTMGGVDQFNATGRVLELLKAWPLIERCRITVVMGAQAPWLERVKQQASTMPCRTEVLVNTSNMAQLMADSDLAIGAAGSTSWERCSLGVPTIMLILARNQEEAAHQLEIAGVAIVLRSLEDLGDSIGAALTRIASPQILRKISENAIAVTDGAGTQRVMHNIFAHIRTENEL